MLPETKDDHAHTHVTCTPRPPAPTITPKAKRNTSSVPYNPITLGYHDNIDGERLRHADTTIRYRAALRAQALQSHMTIDGFNPVREKGRDRRGEGGGARGVLCGWVDMSGPWEGKGVG